MTNQHCGHCHTCGSTLKRVLDGEEWCPTCNAYRRYRSHGWGGSAANKNSESCPSHLIEHGGA